MKDKDCVFLVVSDKTIINMCIDKEDSIHKYFRLKKIINDARHYKVLKSVYAEYRKTNNFDLLVKNSIIG